VTGKRRAEEATVPEDGPTTIESDDDHTTVVTTDQDGWNATATCNGCDWTGVGWHVALESLARNHADGTDGSR
jgi:hypothetical protein